MQRERNTHPTYLLVPCVRDPRYLADDHGDFLGGYQYPVLPD